MRACCSLSDRFGIALQLESWRLIPSAVSGPQTSRSEPSLGPREGDILRAGDDPQCHLQAFMAATETEREPEIAIPATIPPAAAKRKQFPPAVPEPAGPFPKKAIGRRFLKKILVAAAADVLKKKAKAKAASKGEGS